MPGTRDRNTHTYIWSGWEIYIFYYFTAHPLVSGHSSFTTKRYTTQKILAQDLNPIQSLIISQVHYHIMEERPLGKATQGCRHSFDLVMFQKARAVLANTSPSQAFVTIELRDNIISCSELLLCYVMLDFPLHITIRSFFYLQL